MLDIFNVSRIIFIDIVKRLQQFTDMVVFKIIFITFCVISKLFFEIRLNTFEIIFVSLFYSRISNILPLTFKCFSGISSLCTKLSSFCFPKGFFALLFSPFKNFKVSNSEVEGGFSQVDLVLIDLNFWDCDEEQNSVKILTLELEHMLDETE